MRLPILLPALLLPLAASHGAAARPLPVEVFLSSDDTASETIGSIVHGERGSFVFTSPTARDVTFRLNAENGRCGFEMQRSSELGYQPDFGRFPASSTKHAKEGEIFTLSFYQSRTAWMEKAGCSFSLSVQ